MELKLKFEELEKALMAEGLKKADIEILKPLSDRMVEMYTHVELEYYGEKIFVEVSGLTDSQKLQIIDMIHEGYFNTDVDKEIFASEFVTVFEAVSSGKIPVKLKYLLLEELYENIVDVIMQ